MLKTPVLTARRALSPAWSDSLLVFSAGRVYYTLIGLVLWLTHYRPPYADAYYFNIAPVLDGPAGALLGVWQRWDGIHYLRIAIGGYTDNHISLFYPFFPLVGRWLSSLTHLDALASLELVSNLALLLSMVMLHRLVGVYYSRQVARIALGVMVFFPSGFYLYAIFPQSLLLLLFLLTLEFVRRRWWAGAILSGILAGLTHSTAVVLAIPVGIEALYFLWPEIVAMHHKRFRWKWSFLPALIAPFASSMGVAAFMLWRQSAGFTNYLAAQSEMYRRDLTLPWNGVLALAKFAVSMPDTVNQIVAWMNIAIFILMIVMAALSFRRIPWPWWWMQVGFLVFVTTNFTVGYPLIGFFRYCLVIFPLFVELALLVRKPGWRLALFALSLLLSFSYSAMFFMWMYDL